MFFLFFLFWAICLPIFWKLGFLYSVAGRRNRKCSGYAIITKINCYLKTDVYVYHHEMLCNSLPGYVLKTFTRRFGDFWGVFLGCGEGEDEWTCVKWVYVPFWVSSPSLIVRFASNCLTFSLSNVEFLVCRKGHLGGWQGQMVKLSSKTPKQPKCLQKNKKNRNWPNRRKWRQIGQRCIKLKKKGPQKGDPFHGATGTGVRDKTLDRPEIWFSW